MKPKQQTIKCPHCPDWMHKIGENDQLDGKVNDTYYCKECGNLEMKEVKDGK